MLQDQGRNTFGDIDRIAHTMVGQSRDPHSGLVALYTPFTSNDPQLFVSIDREKAKTIGVPLTQITPALEHLYGL